ncbi:MAG: sugar transferase [Chloroflexi bacterium]|nr:sugar transferase [Chloroflexota bacterium]
MGDRLLTRTTQPALYPSLKRSLDVVLASVLLVQTAPVLALCALAVRLESPGPIFFRQERVGKGCQPFVMLKFRSMHANADQRVHQQFVADFINGTADGQAVDGNTVFKLVDDRRVTRVGRWLRRTNLDELPQLWNVVRGDMSLVGPRPPIPYEVEQYAPEDLERFAVPPGITGLWQVSGRNRTTFPEMIALDLQYVHTRSLRNDLAILLKTIPVVVRSAY